MALDVDLSAFEGECCGAMASLVAVVVVMKCASSRRLGCATGCLWSANEGVGLGLCPLDHALCSEGDVVSVGLECVTGVVAGSSPVFEAQHARAGRGGTRHGRELGASGLERATRASRGNSPGVVPALISLALLLGLVVVATYFGRELLESLSAIARDS